MMVLCFDLDSTLIDTWEGERIAKHKLLEELARHSEFPEDLIAREYDALWTIIKQDYMEMLNDGLGEMDIRALHLGQVLEEIRGEDEPRRLARLHWDTMLDKMHIYPDAAMVVETLSEKYRLSLLTNGAGDLQREKIRRLPFNDCFKEIIVSGEHGYHKPIGEIFDLMTKKIDARPEEMVYIGDMYNKDILGARAAGWGTVWVNRRGEDPEGDPPNHTVRELMELLEMFQ